MDFQSLWGVMLCVLHAHGAVLPFGGMFTVGPVYNVEPNTAFPFGDFGAPSPPPGRFLPVGFRPKFYYRPGMRPVNLTWTPRRHFPFDRFNQQPVYRDHAPVVVTLPKTPKKKTSVISGPLKDVVPHPKPQHNANKEKKRARMRAVASAKSFPGNLQNTALEINLLQQ
ncbi:uncharacterized protein LOC127860440 [Dreissena polymorpha]|nr:uncharacterized protein LOC127860440 [Dreissena polymorpha]